MTVPGDLRGSTSSPRLHQPTHRTPLIIPVHDPNQILWRWEDKIVNPTSKTAAAIVCFRQIGKNETNLATWF